MKNGERRGKGKEGRTADVVPNEDGSSRDGPLGRGADVGGGEGKEEDVGCSESWELEIMYESEVGRVGVSYLWVGMAIDGQRRLTR